ncbi:LuxR C-terminal-related transcriptional regulator [Pseudomonas sp. J452]|uniref:LuxR C-terminal-related transcriptional regulator n=1 Tax=Pseudomonas sp. J452 TaxID=2898441 RepID=UPI0021AD99F4|nr:LuxR C-terminal-related transcriptional regulator [Pseudomonas sp. J452]UUY09325.1 LuxR C-terminal-related transcriptional regulator [Pseudomonas sp. J452]
MHDSVRALPMALRQRPHDSALPRLPAAHIARPRLGDALLASDSRLSLVCAPAGFGKSVLLNECVRRAPAGTRVVWLELLGLPLTPTELLTRLATALQLTPGPGEPGAELSLLLGRIEQPLWIILDDYPRQTCAELDACLDQLLERAPHTLRWWISGRRRPAWNLPRLLLQGDLQELDAQALALTEAELERLLEQRQQRLPSALAKQLLQHSEGWLAGVCLLLMGSSADNLAERLLAGTPLLQEYFEREVLAGLPPTLLQALFTLAHMPRFCATLCDQVLEEQDGAALLLELRQRQLFLHGLDGCGEWFRLWRPLASLLKRLSGGQPPLSAHLRACQWFAERGEVREAVQHALCAGQLEVAASYVQRYGQDQLLIGYSVAQFLQWRDELPASLFSSSARLICLQAWALIICARLDEADRCIAELARFLPQPDARRQQQLLAQYQAVTGVLQRQRGLRSARQHCLEALAVLDESGWSQHILCHQALAQQAMAELDLAQAQQHSHEGLRLARLRGNVLFEALISVDHVHLLAMLGERERALEQAEQSLQQLQGAALRGPVLARLLLMRGHLLAGRGSSAEAEQALRTGLQEAEQCQDAYLLFGYLSLAELASASGEFERARQLLRSAERQMQCLHVPEVRYREVLLLAQGELCLHQGEVEQARSHFLRVQQRFETHALLAPSGFFDLQLRVRQGLALAELALGRVDSAVELLQALLGECGQAGHHSLAGEIRVSLAEAQFLAGRKEAAAALVCQALSEAERLQQPRPLLALQQRQGAWLERIVPQLSDPQWCQQHIGTAPALPAGEVCESLLSKREAAVLRLIAQGCSNQQIAEQLYISLHTVKTHARRINVKLGVERRTQAVARAKALGWMG